MLDKLFAIIFTTWFSFGLIALIILSVFYGIYSDKTIKMNDNKSLQSILPLWKFVIITIGYLLNAASTSTLPFSSLLTSFSSFVILGLSTWVLISIQ